MQRSKAPLHACKILELDRPPIVSCKDRMYHRSPATSSTRRKNVTDNCKHKSMHTVASPASFERTHFRHFDFRALLKATKEDVLPPQEDAATAATMLSITGAGADSTFRHCSSQSESELMHHDAPPPSARAAGPVLTCSLPVSHVMRTGTKSECKFRRAQLDIAPTEFTHRCRGKVSIWLGKIASDTAVDHLDKSMLARPPTTRRTILFDRTSPVSKLNNLQARFLLESVPGKVLRKNAFKYWTYTWHDG